MIPTGQTLKWALAACVFWTLSVITSVSQRTLENMVKGSDGVWLDHLPRYLPDGLLWLLLTPLLLHLGSRFPLTRNHLLRRLVLHLVAALVITQLQDLAVRFWLYSMAETGSRPFDPYGARWLHHFIGNPVPGQYLTVLVLHQTWLYNQRNHAREIQAGELERALLEARLTTLNNHLQPHFLFNTLQCINVAAMKQDSDRVTQIVVHLGRLLGKILKDRERQWCSLEEELDFQKDYLTLERFRFEDRMTVDYHIDHQVKAAKVPCFLLQPVVENAVRHGLAKLSDSGKISIRCYRLQDQLCIEVEDDGPGPGSASDPGFGLGLANLRARLELLCGQDCKLELTAAEPRGARVLIRIPFTIITDREAS